MGSEPPNDRSIWWQKNQEGGYQSLPQEQETKPWLVGKGLMSSFLELVPTAGLKCIICLRYYPNLNLFPDLFSFLMSIRSPKRIEGTIQNYENRFLYPWDHTLKKHAFKIYILLPGGWGFQRDEKNKYLEKQSAIHRNNHNKKNALTFLTNIK